MWCAFIEGLVMGFALLLTLATIYGAGKLTWYLIDTYTTSQQKVVKAERVAKSYEQVLLACLNGGLVAVTEHELIGCEPAHSIRK